MTGARRRTDPEEQPLDPLDIVLFALGLGFAAGAVVYLLLPSETTTTTITTKRRIRIIERQERRR